MKAIALFWLVCFLVLAGSVEAAELHLKIFGGLNWFDGGDVNRDIRGWNAYCTDRNKAPYSFSCEFPQFHGLYEGGLELGWDISPRLRLGVSLGILDRERRGRISWEFSHDQEYVLSALEGGTISVNEESSQLPAYRLQAVPVGASLYYVLPVRESVRLVVGGGGSFTFGRMTISEEYTYSFDSIDERTSSGSLLRFVDSYSLSGNFTQKMKGYALGLQAGGGVELMLTESLHLTVEAFGRWVRFKSWKGHMNDEYSWKHTWGYWGVYSDEGSNTDIREGSLWLVEHWSEETGKTYDRFLFSKDAPVSSSYRNPRGADINLDGFSLRVGFKFML